jgi:NADH-quinone oxidoreductase subunit M
LRRTALATLVTLASFVTESAVVLLVLSVCSMWVLLAALGDQDHRGQRRVAAAYLGTSTVLFGAGVVMLIGPGTHGTIAETAGLWLIVIAALIRKGIIPFHAWVPEVFDRGRLGPAILFTAPQLGAYITVVLIVPRASPGMLRTIAMLALATAVYGAALALTQRSARRACGYLFVSQSALVMAGLDCTSATALAGGLLVWLSAGIAFAGLARCVLVLEARRGRLDLTTYHGGYERMPVLASSFLAMGLACTGFPGTLGFVGQELLVTGAIDQFPVMGFAIVIASALTGLAVVRMYFSLFCGRSAPPTRAAAALALKRREAWTFGAVVVTLIGFGIAPRLLVDSRFSAAEDVLRLRTSPSAVVVRPRNLISCSPNETQTGINIADPPQQEESGTRRETGLARNHRCVPRATLDRIDRWHRRFLQSARRGSLWYPCGAPAGLELADHHSSGRSAAVHDRSSLSDCGRPDVGTRDTDTASRRALHLVAPSADAAA